MKKLFALLLTLTLVASMLAACTTDNETTTAAPTDEPTTTAPQEVETIKFSFSDFYPAGHYAESQVFDTYFAMVEEAAGGKYDLEIEYYPASSLLASSQQFDGVASGIADMCATVIGFNPGIFPVMMTLGTPGIAISVSSPAASEAEWEFYQTVQPEELDTVKVVTMYNPGPAWFLSDFEVTTVEQLEGQRVRSLGQYVAGIEACGGTAVGVDMSEAYISKQKGVIDMVLSPIDTLISYNFIDLFDYATFAPHFGNDPKMIIMNWDKWNSLPQDLQDAFDSVAADAAREIGRMWQYQLDQSKEAVVGMGCTLVYMSDAELQKVEDALLTARANLIESLNSQGFDGEYLVDLASEIQAKYNAKEYEPYTP